MVTIKSSTRLYLNTLIGIILSMGNIALFIVLLLGYSVVEPVKWIAGLELGLSVLMMIWFLDYCKKELEVRKTTLKISVGFWESLKIKMVIWLLPKMIETIEEEMRRNLEKLIKDLD